MTTLIMRITTVAKIMIPVVTPMAIGTLLLCLVMVALRSSPVAVEMVVVGLSSESVGDAVGLEVLGSSSE